MRIPNRLPGQLAVSGGTGNIFQDTGVAYNYAIGGLPWLSAASDLNYGHWWIKRETAPFRKDQFDSAQNPGEQSLQGYWIRSQLSFHGGEGQLYADPVQGEVGSDTRYWKGKNVNPWVPGQLTMLNTTTFGAGPGMEGADNPSMISIVYGDGSPGLFKVDGTTTVNKGFWDDVNGTAGFSSAVAPAAAYSACTNGQYIFIHAADGMYRGPIPNTVAGAIAWTKIYTYTGANDGSQIAWVKDRIILGVLNSLYECAPNPPGLPVALPTALYTANTANVRFTSISETTAAVFAIAATGGVSSVLRFWMDDTGELPLLTGGAVACLLPGGEVARALQGYLGTFLALGTSRGLRVAISDDGGNLTYGPLLWDLGTPVRDMAAYDHWMWATYEDPADDEIKLARVDLSNQLDTLRFAYATDLCIRPVLADAGPATGLAFFGNTPYLAFNTANKLWWQTSLLYPDDAYLETSRVRFNTLENKIFRYVRVRGPKLEGQLDVAYLTATGSNTNVYTYGKDQVPGNEDLTLNATGRDWISLRFDLHGDTLGISGWETGAEMTGWQLKALPAVPRQRLITLPLWCFDYETDKHGQRTGGEGTAFERLSALEAAESAGNLLTFQDLDNNVSYDVFIESLEFQQATPPPHWQEPGSFGGRILITMRVV